jgi:DNA-binding transcriptional MerR regulator
MKSATAFRTISEVATDLRVPQHVLRFWETKFPQIRPLKRGGGRRYYRPEDVELLRRIQALLYEERYTIKGVQRLLKEGRVANPTPPLPEDVDDEAASDEAGEGLFAHELDSNHAPEDEPPGLPSDLRHDLLMVLDELKALRGVLARLSGRDEKNS